MALKKMPRFLSSYPGAVPECEQVSYQNGFSVTRHAKLQTEEMVEMPDSQGFGHP